MENAPSKGPETRRSRWIGWRNRLLNIGILVLIVVLYRAFSAYDDQHSTKAAVVGTVDHWSQSQSKGDYHWYDIDVTLPDGSKVSARANPIGPAPPAAGEQIELVKIVSSLGFTRYRWERPILTWEDAVGSDPVLVDDLPLSVVGHPKWPRAMHDPETREIK